MSPTSTESLWGRTGGFIRQRQYCRWAGRGVFIFAQCANVHAFQAVTSLSRAPLMTDRSPAFVIRRGGEPGRYVYVDNLGVIAPSKPDVEAGLEESTRVFDERGLILHDREMLEDGGVSLGVHLDGQLLQSRPDSDRWLRCRAAITHILHRRRCSGAELEILRGRLLILGLSRREVL